MLENTGVGSSPGCTEQRREVDRATVDARWRAGLEPPDAQGQLAKTRGQTIRGRISRPTALVLLETDVNAARQKRADRQHDGARAELEADLRRDTGHATPVDRQVCDLLLKQLEVRLALEQRAYRASVQRTVGLCTGCADGGTLAGIERAELDSGAVGGTRHRAAERVDLLDQVTLADAADRRVAAHLPQRVDALRQQQRPRAGARRGQRGLGAGVAAADDDDIEMIRMTHG